MYSPWYWHNKALREHLGYQLEGLMDCFREEQSFYQPYRSIEDTHTQNNEQPEPEWTKKQWDIINQLRGMVQFLYLKETERRANASKRKPKYKQYTNE